MKNDAKQRRATERKLRRAAEAKKHREGLIAFLERRGLKPAQLAKLGKFSPSAIYNFLSGNSDGLSGEILGKMAIAANTSIDEILGGASVQSMVPVIYTVGVFGRMFELTSTEPITAPRPVGVSSDLELAAAVVRGDGLHPIPSGWTIYFTKAPVPLKQAMGKMCVVRRRGDDQPLIREVRQGKTPGLATLLSWSSSPIEDAEIEAAHPIVAMTQPA